VAAARAGRAEWAAFRASSTTRAAPRRRDGALLRAVRDPRRLASEPREPAATLLVLPNGWVKVAAALPEICADLRRDRLQTAWNAYRDAWRSDRVKSAARAVLEDDVSLAQANAWLAPAGRRIDITAESP
jgi:hypothetical protein